MRAPVEARSRRWCDHPGRPGASSPSRWPWSCCQSPSPAVRLPPGRALPPRRGTAP